jgi:anti-sigma regulatory factor (Ser/Thr protein kinase)
VRSVVRETASSLEFSPERVFDIEVASSEATANAIEYIAVGQPVIVTLSLSAEALHIEVAGQGEFELPSPGEDRAQRGLGLPLMAKLTDQLILASQDGGAGTIVVLRFDRQIRGDVPRKRRTAANPEEAIAANQRLVAEARTKLEEMSLLQEERLGRRGR